MTAMAVVLGCSACGVSIQGTRDTLVPGVTPRQIALGKVSPATDAYVYGDREASSTVVIFLEPGITSPQYVAETVSALHGAGHAVLTAEGKKAWTAGSATEFFASMFPDENSGAVLGIVAFGVGQNWAWDAIALLSGKLDWAFLTSCPLPSPAPDFAQLRRTSVEVAYAESGRAYASSYLKAHHAMRAVPTPHEFLIYGGGVQDGFYDNSSSEYHEPTWRAVREEIVEWAHHFSG